MGVNANAASASVAQQMLHFSGPLGMRRAAKAEAIGKEAGPILTRAKIAPLIEAQSPNVLLAGLAVPIVSVAPEPGGQRLLLVGLGALSQFALVDCRLDFKQSLEV